MKSLCTSNILLLTIALVGLSQNVNANHQKRSRRYPSYEHNSLDVLNGINEGEYEQIYIHYHGCVWSEFDGGDCGGDGGGEGGDNDAEWYMGKTQCYRANVAYSLYGIRVDDKKRRKNNVCQRRYFINTFFTNNGVENFGDAVGLANGGDATSECTAQGNDDENANNGDSAAQNGARMNANAQSYTTYCNRSRKFVTAQFGGAFCTDTSSLQLLDSLDTLNNELDNVGCLLVYSNDGNVNANANENAEEDEEEEEEQEGDENEDQEGEENGDDDEGRRLEDADAQEGNDGGLWNLLAYSNVCSALEYPRGCPDPYGAKKRFDVNAKSSNGFWKQFMWLDWLTLFFFFIAIVMLVLAYCVYKDRRKRSKSQKTSTDRTARKSSRFGRSTNSKSKDTSQKTQNQASGTTEVKRTASTNTQKSKKGLFRGMFRKNKDTNTSSS